MVDVSNTDDIIDSRDVIERIEELEAEREALADDLAEAESALADAEENEADNVDDLQKAVDDAHDSLTDWDADDGEELEALKALADEASGYAPDWQYGESLIRDSYFREYAMELADDIGAIDSSASWPLTCIDWDQAARKLQMDYTAVDFSGITYWIR